MLNALVLRKYQETFLIGTRNTNHEPIHVSNHLIGRIGGQFFSCLKKEGSEPEFFYFLKKISSCHLKKRLPTHQYFRVPPAAWRVSLTREAHLEEMTPTL